MKSKFRVLIVDDKKSVLDDMKALIPSNILVGTEEVSVEILPLYVEVQGSGQSFHICDPTIKKLIEYSSHVFDLILMDYGYSKEDIHKESLFYSLQKEYPQKSARELIDIFLLNPATLVEATKKYKDKKLKKNFYSYSGKLYIYTFTPSQFENDYTTKDVKENITNNHFQKASVKVVDARNELFNATKFEEKYDPDFYGFLISKYLSKIVQIEVAEACLSRTLIKLHKLEKVKMGNMILSISIVIPSLLAGVFIPSILSSIGEQLYISAIALIIVLVIIIILFTIGSGYFEKKQREWLK